MRTAFPVICNGTPKSGTHALLQAVEAMGFAKYAFVRALTKDKPCYARRINYNEESLFLSPQANREFAAYLKNTPKIEGLTEVSQFLRDAPDPSRAVIHSHVNWRNRSVLRGMTTVTIIRNPRDNFLSWLRWFGAPTAGEFFSTYASFLSWRKDNLFVYERLWEAEHIIALGNTIGLVLTQQEVDYVKFKSKGKSLTWTNEPSDHQSVWNAERAAFWKKHRGEWLDAAYAQIVAEWNVEHFPAKFQE